MVVLFDRWQCFCIFCRRVIDKYITSKSISALHHKNRILKHDERKQEKVHQRPDLPIHLRILNMSIEHVDGSVNLPPYRLHTYADPQSCTKTVESLVQACLKDRVASRTLLSPARPRNRSFLRSLPMNGSVWYCAQDHPVASNQTLVAMVLRSAKRRRSSSERTASSIHSPTHR